jgi:hypothetical protein
MSRKPTTNVRERAVCASDILFCVTKSIKVQIALPENIKVLFALDKMSFKFYLPSKTVLKLYLPCQNSIYATWLYNPLLLMTDQ